MLEIHQEVEVGGGDATADLDEEGQQFLKALEDSLMGPRMVFMSNRLIQHVIAGTFTRELYIGLLRETWHFVRNTPTFILTAAARLEPGDEALRSRFIRHAREETGHDRWALDDLQALGVDPEEVRRSIPLPHTSALVAYQFYTIEHLNPKGLLGLEYALEGSTARSGGALVARAQQLLQLPDDAVRFFSRHALADRDHAEADAQTIARFVRTEADRAAVVRNARDSYVLYAALYNGVCDALRC